MKQKTLEDKEIGREKEDFYGGSVWKKIGDVICGLIFGLAIAILAGIVLVFGFTLILGLLDGFGKVFSTIFTMVIEVILFILYVFLNMRLFKKFSEHRKFFLGGLITIFVLASIIFLFLFVAAGACMLAPPGW